MPSFALPGAGGSAVAFNFWAPAAGKNAAACAAGAQWFQRPQPREGRAGDGRRGRLEGALVLVLDTV